MGVNRGSSQNTKTDVKIDNSSEYLMYHLASNDFPVPTVVIAAWERKQIKTPHFKWLVYLYGGQKRPVPQSFRAKRFIDALQDLLDWSCVKRIDSKLVLQDFKTWRIPGVSL
jgi:hypothetical protein